MSWCRWVFSSNAVNACTPRWSVNAPGATPQSTPQVGTSFTPVRQGPPPGARSGRGPPSAGAGGAAQVRVGLRVPGAGAAGGRVGTAGTPGSGGATAPGGGAGADTVGSPGGPNGRPSWS